MEKLREYAKAAAAFLSVLAGAAAALAASPEIRSVFPEEWVAILTALASAGVVAGIVAGIPNKVTPAQAARSGVTVAPAVVAATEVIAVPSATPDAPVFVPQHYQPEPPLPTSGGSLVDDIIADYTAKRRAEQ